MVPIAVPAPVAAVAATLPVQVPLPIRPAAPVALPVLVAVPAAPVPGLRGPLLGRRRIMLLNQVKIPWSDLFRKCRSHLVRCSAWQLEPSRAYYSNQHKGNLDTRTSKCF
jgi:hypothetical protein